MSKLELKNITLSYGNNTVLQDLNLTVEDGEFVSLLGPSGCGKTTTLRLISGFLNSDSGQILLNGEDISNIPVHKRGFGYMFQNYALFPHMTVADNVAFGLKQQGVDSTQIQTRVGEILEIVGMGHLSERLPKELSGGQKQRVALARALVIRPKILLFDEPLSNLDAKMRIQMRMEIRRLQEEFNITTIFVTHDQEEAFSISDKITIMNGGCIEQMASPEEIYANPANADIAKFVGFENVLSGVYNGQYFDVNGTEITLPINHGLQMNDAASVAYRPENLTLSNKGMGIKGTVITRTFLGKTYQYAVQTDMGIMFVDSQNDYAPKTPVVISNTGKHAVILK